MRLAPWLWAVVETDTCTVGVHSPVVSPVSDADRWWFHQFAAHVAPPPPPSPASQQLWDAAAARGWLEQAQPRPVRVRIHGAGSLATALGVALAQCRITSVGFMDHRSRHHTDSWAYTATVPADVGAARAAAWTVRDASPTVVVSGPERPADLHLVVSLGTAPRSTLLDCMANDAPHLVVTAADGLVTVGPWVIPGLTPCWWCFDPPHRVNDRSSAVSGALPPVVPPWQGWIAAGVVGRMVTAWRDHGVLDFPMTAITADGEITTATPRVHPDCGCGYRDVGAPAAATISRM